MVQKSSLKWPKYGPLNGSKMIQKWPKISNLAEFGRKMVQIPHSATPTDYAVPQCTSAIVFCIPFMKSLLADQGIEIPF